MIFSATLGDLINAHSTKSINQVKKSYKSCEIDDLTHYLKFKNLAKQKAHLNTYFSCEDMTFNSRPTLVPLLLHPIIISI